MGPTEIERASTRSGIGTSSAQAWLRALQATAPIAGQPTRILPTVIDEVAERQGGVRALLSTRECLSYRELAERKNRYARWALACGIGKGDVVALLMGNCPDYLAIWLGITRVGGTVALLNTNLVGAALAHCIDIARPAQIIVSAELLAVLDGAQPGLTKDAKVWLHGADGRFSRIEHEVGRYSGTHLADGEAQPVTIKDRALLIYTSGTTGLPKAANVSHYRLMQWSLWFAGLMDTSPADRMYDCLPMYHSVGGAVATGAMLVRGGSVVIREKFSVQDFWDDVVNWDCTLFQYIGELCRYLVNAPERPCEKKHRLRLCCGNGLRADVWEKFQNRFAIPRMLEFYAATEGNVSLYNVEDRVGSIGRIPSFLAHRFPLALVKSDPATNEPIRDDGGRCIRCATGELGEAIGRIYDGASRPAAEFEGYTDAKESERKIIRDAFEHGDAWYRTGDLMRTDTSGYYYFVDRIGDTFRWKGENVATSEVAAAISAFSGIIEAVVYGVSVPGAEGSAGMAAVVVGGTFELQEFHNHVAHLLPSYARPLFLRIKDRIEMTSTFKHTKAELVSDGFDPRASNDALYFDDPSRRAYVQLDSKLFERIRAGGIRL
jgi:fatty-acyl-CoA synthase